MGSHQEQAPVPALPTMETVHPEEARYPESIARAEKETRYVVPCLLPLTWSNVWKYEKNNKNKWNNILQYNNSQIFMIVKFVANKGRGRDLKRDLPLLIVVLVL